MGGLNYYEITNQSDDLLGILSMYAIVRVEKYEQTESILLGDSNATLRFEIPVVFGDKNATKVFYGVYMSSGRGVYLNGIYLYKANRVVNIFTDKQVYNVGE